MVGTGVTSGAPDPPRVVVLTGHGDGTFDGPLEYPSASDALVAIADLNADGKLDLAASGGPWVRLNELTSNTPGGSSVTVVPVDPTTGDTPATITFANVTQPGETQVTSASTGPVVPGVFTLASAYYELTTTAVFDSAEVCFRYSGFPAPSILHWVGGVPELEPTTRDTGTRRVRDRDVVLAVRPRPARRRRGYRRAGGRVRVGGRRVARRERLDRVHGAGRRLRARRPGRRGVLALDGRRGRRGGRQRVDRDAAGLRRRRELRDRRGRSQGTRSTARRRRSRSRPPGRSTPPRPRARPSRYLASATDGAHPSPTVSCAPATGSVFAIGTTTVACTATDHVGNTAGGSFTVTVRGAKEQLARLVNDVVAASALPAAVKAQLLARLQPLLAGFDPSNPAQRKAVCTGLSLFTAVLRCSPATASRPRRRPPGSRTPTGSGPCSGADRERRQSNETKRDSWSRPR